jgi:hypothetical protein
VIELRSSFERLVEPIPRGVVIELQPMARLREYEMHPDPSMLHPASVQDPESEFAVEVE